MTGSPKIVEALLALKELSSTVRGHLHDQEHLWEAMEYHKLEKVFDQANREVWDDIHHRLLKRAYDLGGRPEGVSEDPAGAYSAALQDFTALHEACQELYELVEDDGDYVTEKMLMKIQKEVEAWINYFEAKLAQVRNLGPKPFLSEQM